MKHTMHGKKLLTNKKATQSSSQKEPIDEIRKMFVLVINKINMKDRLTVKDVSL